MTEKNHNQESPSPWITRFSGDITPKGAVLDLACGAGRHSRYFMERSHPVTALDRDTSRLERRLQDLEVIEADLEDAGPFPLAGRQFAAVIVTNYLYRPLFPDLLQALSPNGLLLYETFAQGNEAFGKPSNPNYLLQPGELLEAVRGRLRVIAYEDLVVKEPRPAAIQRIAARRETT